jgi:hypothetical protein
MTNSKYNHFRSHVFPRQPHTTIVQLLPTSGLVQSDTRSSGHHPAGMPRISPRDVKNDISFARLPADQKGERHHQSTQTDPRSIWDIRNRPDSVPAHTRLSEPNGDRDTHQRPGRHTHTIRLHPQHRISPKRHAPRHRDQLPYIRTNAGQGSAPKSG